jgi:hypothetical protein
MMAMVMAIQVIVISLLRLTMYCIYLLSLVGFGQCLDINLSYSDHEEEQGEEDFQPNKISYEPYEEKSHLESHQTDPLNLSGTFYAEEQELDELKKLKWFKISFSLSLFFLTLLSAYRSVLSVSLFASLCLSKG